MWHLIPIVLHLRKLNGHHHLCYTSIFSSHAINAVLDSSHTKNHLPHRFSTSNLTVKQQAKLKSPIKDINKCLLEIIDCFDPLHSLFSPGSRVVNHFSSRVTFYTSFSSSPENVHKHMQCLNQVFYQSQNLPHNFIIVANDRVKKSNIVHAITYIWLDNYISEQVHCQTMNVTL